MKTRYRTLQEGFAARVVPQDSGCHFWTGCVNTNGYGQMCGEGQTWSTHRYAWTQANGPIPPGMWVLHRCDVRRCVNPEHLFLGTAQDNSRDMVAKGRKVTNRGESHKLAKLTDGEVREIRLRYNGARGDITRLAKAFGVSRNAIERVVKGTGWKHVD